MKILDFLKYVYKFFRFKKNEQVEPETFVEFIGKDNEKNINKSFSVTTSPLHNKNKKFFFNKVDECCICLNPLDSKKTIKMSGCQHEIHIVCAKGWLYEKSECPLCRNSQSRLKKRLNI